MFFIQKRRVLFSFPSFLFFILLLPLSIRLSGQDTATLKTVVIQATRAGEKGPVPHTNISADQIARTHQAQDMPYLLGGVPSLVESSDAGAGIGYTGLRIRGSDPTRINVTINGVPINDAESQGMFWVDLPDLAASASEVQVQRGVGVSTNGAGSFGATINVDLSKVSAEPFAQISGTIGSFNTRKTSVLANTGLINGQFAFGARVSNIQSDGYIDRASADLQSIHLTGAYISGRQSIQAHILDGYEKTYQAWYGLPAQYFDAGTPLTYNPAGTERADLPHPNEVDDYHQRHHLLHYKLEISPKTMLQVNGHYTRGKGFYEQYKANEDITEYGMPAFESGGITLNTSDLIRRRWLDNYFYGTTWALVHQQKNVKFTWGGGLSRYEGKHFGEVTWAGLATVPAGFRYYENDADKKDKNTFLKTEMTFGQKWSALVDIQIRSVNYTFLGYNNNRENVTQSDNLFFFNPKIGLNYAVSGASDLYLFLGTGHREPNRDDYTQSTPASRPKAEQLYNLETGFKSRAASWTAGINVFGMYYRNQLVLDGRINDVGAYIRTNVPKSYRAGVEIEANGSIAEKITLGGNISLSSNKVVDFTEYRDNWADGSQLAIVYKNTDLAFSPNIITRGEAGIRLLPTGKKQQLTATVTGKYIGRQFLDNTSNSATSLAAYGFVDGRLNYQIQGSGKKSINIIAAVNNVLNARYASNGWAYRFTSPGYDPRNDDPYTRQETGDTYHQAGFFPQAGRNYQVTAQVNF